MRAGAQTGAPARDRTRRARRRAGRRACTTLALALLALGTTACDRLLEVENPGRVPAESLEDPALIPALEAGSLQQFQCGFAAYVATAGMLSGEYISANGFVDNHIWEWRGIPEIKANPGGCSGNRNNTFLGFYTPLQQARFQLDDLAARLSTLTDAQVPNRARIQAEATAYAGYAYTLLAEGMCELAFDGGPIVSRADALAIAEKRFTDAIGFANTANDASLRNMATVGRARARLDRGNLTGAAADAALVPAGFVRNAEYSEVSVPRENRLFNLTIRNDFLSVGEAYRNLTLPNGAADPRVKVVRPTPLRNGSDNVTPIWQQQKFIGTGGVSLPIASYAEAQLILAEATGGQAGLDAINRVRALSNVPAITAVPADFTALVIEERRRQLFSEGHRYGDMLRKNIPFQTGVNRKGQSFSTLTCVPLPDVETRTNPNLKS